METSDKLYFLRKELTNIMSCFSKETIDTIIDGDFDSSLIDRDKIMQNYDLDIIYQMLSDFSSKFLIGMIEHFELTCSFSVNGYIYENLQEVFNDSDINPSHLIRLKNNFENLERWVDRETALIQDFTMADFASELEVLLQLSMVSNKSLIYYIIENGNLSLENKSQELTALLDKIFEIADVESVRERISKAISNKIIHQISTAKKIKNLNYYWFKRSINKERTLDFPYPVFSH